jgi:hypothetical protein
MDADWRHGRQEQQERKAMGCPAHAGWRLRWFALIHFGKDVPCYWMVLILPDAIIGTRRVLLK